MPTTRVSHPVSGAWRKGRDGQTGTWAVATLGCWRVAASPQVHTLSSLGSTVPHQL